MDIQVHLIMTQTFRETILFILKFFMELINRQLPSMYNALMTNQRPSRRASPIFLILGITFLAIGIATDQTAFTWVAIAFLVISLVRGGRWLRRRK